MPQHAARVDEPIFRISLNVLPQRTQKENCGRRNLSPKTTAHEIARKTQVRLYSRLQKLRLGDAALMPLLIAASDERISLDLQAP